MNGRIICSAISMLMAYTLNLQQSTSLCSSISMPIGKCFRSNILCKFGQFEFLYVVSTYNITFTSNQSMYYGIYSIQLYNGSSVENA